MAAAITMGSIAILLSLTITGTIFFQYASAFVNIVSPERGEAVPAGSSLTVSGTSDDNPQFNCKIQIIVNDHRPYQDTIPVAPGDYSKWTFVINPQYAEIEEGINTITSKATCDAPYETFLKLDPLTRQYVKSYGINVTGVPSGLQGEGVDSEEPFVFPPPGEESTDEGDRAEAGEGEGGEGGEDEDGGDEESLFG
jgi:hypothetical protein